MTNISIILQRVFSVEILDVRVRIYCSNNHCKNTCVYVTLLFFTSLRD